MLHLSSNIKYIRDLHDLTQDEMADKIGVTLAALGSYERGFRNPKDSVCKIIAQMVGIEVDELKNEDLKTYTLTYINKEGMQIKLTPAISRDQQDRLEQKERELEAAKELIKELKEQLATLRELLLNKVEKS